MILILTTNVDIRGYHLHCCGPFDKFGNDRRWNMKSKDTPVEILFRGHSVKSGELSQENLGRLVSFKKGSTRVLFTLETDQVKVETQIKTCVHYRY